MLCSSVILGPQLHWKEFWSHLIVLGYNYVPVNRDWSNLLSVYSELEANTATTAQIAQNARKTMELLDARGVSCYVRELIRRYANVCDWKVEAPPPRERRRAGVDWMSIEDYFISTLKAGS
jgi:hypothetical protein